MAGDRMPWWTFDRVIDITGIAIAVVPWGFPGPSAVVRVAVAASCATGWIIARRWTSSFEMPLAIIPLSLIARLVVFVAS